MTEGCGGTRGISGAPGLRGDAGGDAGERQLGAGSRGRLPGNEDTVPARATAGPEPVTTVP